jgi:hypothetical protein
MQIDVGAPRRKQNTRLRNWLMVVLGGCALVAVAVLAWARVPPILGLWNYQPRAGDVIFQSLPHSRVVNAIEGATGSPYSHCGIVAQEDGAWMVYEAFGPVGPSPLAAFVARGRGEAFAVYRLREAHQPLVPAVLDSVRRFQGRPYDERYRLDDDAEKIYCSELIYLAYREATGGEALGREVTLGELRWQPFRQVIERIEKGPPPLDRSFITPRDLARASQLERFYTYGYRR